MRCAANVGKVGVITAVWWLCNHCAFLMGWPVALTPYTLWAGYFLLSTMWAWVTDRLLAMWHSVLPHPTWTSLATRTGAAPSDRRRQYKKKKAMVGCVEALLPWLLWRRTWNKT